MRLGPASLIVCVAMAASGVIACNYVIGYDKLIKVNRPVQFLPDGAVLISATEVALGAKHSCARYDDGSLRCWGDNADGQLGVGDTQARLVPTLVHDVADVVSISLGNRHTCATMSNGETRCWGAVADETRAHGGADTEAPLVDPATAVPWESFASNHDHACGVREGLVYCFGRNDEGQLGLGHRDDVATPTPTPAITKP